MLAGLKYEYYWVDGQIVKKFIKCFVLKYIDYFMLWV